jgi:hypothetical protein
VPLCHDHYPTNGFDVGVGNALLKEIAHRIHEYEFRRAPRERLRQLLGNQLQVEALLVRMALDPAKPLGKRLGVAVFTTGADLCAAAHGVPGCVRPFDVRVE